MLGVLVVEPLLPWVEVLVTRHWQEYNSTIGD